MPQPLPSQLVTMEYGELIFNEAYQKRLESLMRATGLSGERRDHVAMGQALIEPIRKIADYIEWAKIFFTDVSIAPGQDNRIPVDDYTVVGFYSSPDGQVLYTRPGRQYTRPDFTGIRVGLELGWDDMAEAMWNVQARKMLEAAEELARKRDTLARDAFDAAVTSISGHTATVASTLTKASVDAAFKAQAAIGFPIKRIAINTGTLIDMTTWVTSAATSNAMWLLTDRAAEDIKNRLYISNYGGAAWFASWTVPSNYVYMSGDPDKVGYRQFKGGIRAASDIDIDKGVDKHRWDQKLAMYVGNPYNLYRIQITA